MPGTLYHLLPACMFLPSPAALVLLLFGSEPLRSRWLRLGLSRVASRFPRSVCDLCLTSFLFPLALLGLLRSVLHHFTDHRYSFPVLGLFSTGYAQGCQSLRHESHFSRSAPANAQRSFQAHHVSRNQWIGENSHLPSSYGSIGGGTVAKAAAPYSRSSISCCHAISIIARSKLAFQTGASISPAGCPSCLNPHLASHTPWLPNRSAMAACVFSPVYSAVGS